MKFLKIYKRLLKRELDTLTAQLSKLQEEIRTVELQISETYKELEKKKKFLPENSLEMIIKDNYIKHLKTLLEKLNQQLQQLITKENSLKEKIAFTKSRLKLLEKTEKNIKIKAEKREDQLLERFINEVLGHNNRSAL
jgi:chromosome segregation ATPase